MADNDQPTDVGIADLLKLGSCGCGHQWSGHSATGGCFVCPCPMFADSFGRIYEAGVPVTSTRMHETGVPDGQLVLPEVTDDPVNHPKHYTHYRGIEIIQLTEQMNFNRGNAVKYTARAGIKDPDTEIEDLEKAVWYLTREIKRVKELKDE